jgi:hypothetical protein
MAATKEKHYAAQLYAALTSGSWSASFPGKDWKGSLLSWPEVFRKFKKHNPELSEFAEVASQLHALSLWLSTNSKVGDNEDGDQKAPYGSLALGQECVLPEERKAEAEEALNALQVMKTTDVCCDVSWLPHYYSLSTSERQACPRVLRICAWQANPDFGGARPNFKHHAQDSRHRRYWIVEDS